MFNFLAPEAPSLSAQQVAHTFRWLGWTGFLLQILLGFIPLLVVVSNVMLGPAQRQTAAVPWGLWLAIACLAILVFSIYWSFRYIRLARKLEDPDRRPAKAEVLRDLKFGLIANILIMVFAVLIALARVGEITFKMLRLPQGATMIVPGQTGTAISSAALLTPSNMIAIQAMVNAIAAGLVGTIVALLLIFLVGQHRNANS